MKHSSSNGIPHVGLFQVALDCSGLFQPVLLCCSMCRVVLVLQTAALQNVLICKFIENELHVRFYYKVGQCYYKVGQF